MSCKHYKRGATIVAPCCDKVYACRFCHNDDEMHEIDRRAIKEMICLTCSFRQPIAQYCSRPGCLIKIARYYCDICKFLDDSPTKNIYHCVPCGICRVRGENEDYFHCDKCNICMSLSLKDSHPCTERALESNCPVCSEWMQESTTPCVRLPCKHFMHYTCLEEYARNSSNYICPICSRSIISVEHRRILSTQIDDFIEVNPTPPEYKDWKVEILCNDCLEKADVAFQITKYYKCTKCMNYNTTVVGEKR